MVRSRKRLFDSASTLACMTKPDLEAPTLENLKNLFGRQFGNVIATGRGSERISYSDKPQEDPAVFAARFSRCYRLLHFLARRVLGGPERVEEAIENCLSTASRNPPRFEYEGAFRSWLIRVLIDEALALLRKSRGANVKAVES